MKSNSSKHSISEINSYMNCRKAHHYRYRLKIHSEPAPSMLAGTAIHWGLEVASTAMKNKTGLIPLGGVIDSAVEKASELGLFGAEARIEWAVTAGYQYLQEMAEAGWEVLESEQFIETGYGTWNARGQIDLVMRRGEEVLVIDWKTCGKLPGCTSECIDPQTTLYSWAVMEQLGVDELTAGRVYLRTVDPRITLTKAGKVSKQSVCSFAAYKDFVKASPDACFGLEEAESKFGHWYREDTTRLTREHCEAILGTVEKIASEIDMNLEPHPNFRPKFCPNFCSHYAQCEADILKDAYTKPDGYELS